MANVLLRLSDQERESLKILISALKVSEYTDDVDSYRGYQRSQKLLPALKEAFQTMVGLSMISKAGVGMPPAVQRKLLANRGENLSDFPILLGPYFEVARRYKRLNPDKIRSEYGKLLMILQDCRTREAQLESSKDQLMLPTQTVGSALQAAGLSALLDDADLDTATTYDARVSSASKETTRNALIDRYGKEDTTARALVERCIRSIDDTKYFIYGNVKTIDTLRKWLREDFSAEDKKYSLAIRNGKDGSCLTHNHSDHQQYVMEALTLWKIIHCQIFDFWDTVEEDMVGLSSDGYYSFRNTGQGYHRVSSAPRTYSRMQRALSDARAEMGGRWVGSTVVHLGDNDVPNPFVFIDKYTIIPKLLNPIVSTIREIERIFADETGDPARSPAVSAPPPSSPTTVPAPLPAGHQYPGLKNLLKAKYGGGAELRKTILCDFFKHGFDGSGDDGGSCIDGRLTSAWNWCSLLHKKPYYDAFVLTGFSGFDSAYN